MKCGGCRAEVDGRAKFCPHCGRENPARAATKANGGVAFALVVVVALFAVCYKLKGTKNAEEQKATKAAVAPPETWNGPAGWVNTLQAALLKSKTLKPVDTIRKDGKTSVVYDLSDHSPRSSGTLERLDGKPGAWRWSVISAKVAPRDLAPRQQLEKLFQTQSGMEWFRVSYGDFDGTYVGFKPAKDRGADALLSVQTLAFAQDRNDNGLMPWLCSHQRVLGVTGLSSEGMSGRCQELVKEMLKAPSTAKFAWDDDDRPSYYGNCNMEWTSWVEAKNVFGVPIKNTFVCTYDARSEKLRARFR